MTENAVSRRAAIGVTTGVLASIVIRPAHGQVDQGDSKAKQQTQTDGTNAMTNIDFSGTWRNQRGSTMVLTQNSSSGAITGDYTTLVGSGGGALTKPIVGQAHGDQIVFFVDWWPYSMTSWAGQALTQRDGTEVLETVWTNTKEVSDSEEPNDGWTGLRTGGDSFTRV